MRSPLPLPLLALIAPLLPSPAPVTASGPAQERRADPSDRALRAAWRRLDDGERREVAAWFAAEVARLDTLQNRLMGAVLGRLDRARYDWPAAPERPPLYDPSLHAPAQPIARHWIDDGRGSAGRFVEKVLRKSPPRPWRPAWAYDYGQRTVLGLGGGDEPEHVFENALAGVVPDQDLVEALVERALDDGSLQTVHAALGHAYADREGRAYPRVTLYDALASGVEIEMPDVECLGVVHTVLDDWRRWSAPVPASEHDELYDTIGGLFERAYAQRELRRTLARTFLFAEPEVNLAYGPHRDRFHALWAQRGPDPAALVAELPGSPEELAAWIERAGARLDSDREVWAAGQARKRALLDGAARVRATLVGVMREFGALGGR